MSRNGKIARLPGQIREEVNRRLYDGEDGRKIIDWLNSADQVKASLAGRFDEPLITKGNLCEWRKGGYRDWEARQFALEESRRVMEEGKELGETGQGALADHLGTWIVGQYIVATRRMQEKIESGDDAGAWKLLRELCHDVVALRRGDHGAEWLRLEQERLKLQRQKQESQREKLKEEIRQENPPREPMSQEEEEQRWCEIFGVDRETHPAFQKRKPFAAAPEAGSDSPDSDDQPPPESEPSVAEAVESPPPEPSPEDLAGEELQQEMDLAETGDPYSAYCLGSRYRDGCGVPMDLPKARHWLEIAASGGVAPAKTALHSLLTSWIIEAGVANAPSP